MYNKSILLGTLLVQKQEHNHVHLVLHDDLLRSHSCILLIQNYKKMCLFVLTLFNHASTQRHKNNFVFSCVAHKMTHGKSVRITMYNQQNVLLCLWGFGINPIKLLTKFAHKESNLLTENQFCSRRIINCPSFYLQSKYGLMTQFLSIHKLLKAKKICSHTTDHLACERVS